MKNDILEAVRNLLATGHTTTFTALDKSGYPVNSLHPRVAHHSLHSALFVACHDAVPVQFADLYRSMVDLITPGDDQPHIRLQALNAQGLEAVLKRIDEC